MARIVLADASPLIVLARAGGLQWLGSLFGQVHVPLAVRREVLPGQGRAGEPEIRDAITNKLLVVLSGEKKLPLFPHLGEGEASCIREAIPYASDALVLMDDRAGRTTAVEHGVQLAGTAAVIAMARRRHLIPSAAAVFERLLQMDFRISAEVIRAALAAAGESPKS